jgi:hypothetical protein
MAEKKTGELRGEPVHKGAKRYCLKWGENRRHELMIGPTMIVFGPYGEQIVDESLVSHPDFQAVQHQFGVSEVRT